MLKYKKIFKLFLKDKNISNMFLYLNKYDNLDGFMNKNIKKLFLLTTVLMILLTISAIDATEVNNDTVIDDSSVSSQNIISDSVKDTVSDTGDNKEITKKDVKNDVVTKGAATHIVNNDNVDEIFSGAGYNLSDTINEGDTLDFQGLIDKQHAIKISKPVNIISSTKDAVISLHSSAPSYSSGNPGNAFVVNTGASGSNITGLYLDNTQFWVYDAENIYFKNMSMIVKNAQVGTGTGQTAIRYSNNITLDECHIYTENNGGSTSVAFTVCSNCTIENSIIEGYGTVGNILTLGNTFNVDDKPEEYEGMYAPQFALIMQNMDVFNCTLNTPNGGGICEPLMYVPKGSRIENNIINATGGTAKAGSSGTFINNTLINGVGLDAAANAVITGNIIESEATVNIKAANVNFTNNTLNGVIDVTGKSVIINENHIESTTIPAIKLSSSATDATITNNYIVAGDLTGDNAISIQGSAMSTATVSGNLPEPVAEVVIITDDTYSNFFNSDGTIIEGMINATNEVQFDGTFNSRNFVITIPITITTGENQAVFDKCTFKLNAIITVENVQFTGDTNNVALIEYNSTLKFINTTFDSINTGSANLFNPKKASTGISFTDCKINEINGSSLVRSTYGSTSITSIGSEFTNINSQYSLFNVNGQTWNIFIKDSKFTDNQGQNGGIIQVMSSKLRDVISIDNSVFERNTAKSKAGVIYSAGNSANITITNSNFTDNGVPEQSSGSSVTDLAGVIDIANTNANLYLSNNIMTGSIANNNTDIYVEGVKKIYTDAKLIAENASTPKDELVDLKFKITDDMGNLIGFAANRFNYTATLNDEEISVYENVPTYPIYGFNAAANKTINATYPAGTYPITLEIKNGDSLFNPGIEIVNGQLEVIDSAVILTDETWDQFFNEDGTLKEGVVEEGGELQFHGTFTNRQMNITTPITITTGEEQAVFNGCTFTISSPTTIKNVEFTGETSSHTITANANLTFENVTFDAVKANGAYMIDPAVRANITFNNCTVSNFEGNAVVRSSAKRTGISVTVIDSVFKDNNAAFSVFCEFGNGWTINLTNSNFTNNNGQNGAVVQGMSTGTTLKLYIDNCNFDSNTATGKAGVIYSASNNAVISITNSNFTDNKVSSTSSGSSTTNLAQVITLGTGNTDLTLQNNIMSGSTAENGTDIYFELSSAGTGKIYTAAKLTAENASVDKDQFVDLKFKLTDDMGNFIGFKAGNVFNYSVTVNDEVISFVDGGPYYGNLYGFYGSQNKTINATYPGGLYPITIDVTAGADKFDSLEITNGQLEVIAPKPTPIISYEVINDVEGKVAIEFTVLDEENNEITSAPLVLSGDITATVNTGKVYKNSELTEGVYAVNVKFEETEDYQEATLDFNLTVQKDPQEIIDELNESLINNQTALEGNISALEQLQAENEALQAQIENLTEALESNQTALAGNITALEEANEQIAQLEQNITTLTEALEANQTALAEAQEALEEANEQIAQLEQNITTLTEALEANQTALAEAQETIDGLNDQIDELESALEANQTALAEAEETITELNNNITALEEELAETQSALAESEEENANLTAKVAELEAALEANQTALAEAEETIDGLNDQIDELESALEANQTALAEAEETITELENNITSLENELNETQNELADTQEALDDANESIEDLNNVIDALEDELEQTQNELADTQEALDDANEAIEDLEYKVSELELALNIAEKALDKAIDAITELNQPKATTISIDPITGAKYGDEINITGLLVNEDAIGLANQPVTITLNGEEIEVTTRNGEFTYTTTADIIGENTITVSYAGNDKYVESEASATFEVAKANSTIELSELEAVKKGDVLTISGVLYDHNNNALDNKVVRLLVNNGRKTVKTNKMGEFSFDYTTTRVGINTLTATFEGNDYYEATTAESTFTVEALSTIITFDDMSQVIKGTEATISGTLTDEKGNVIANAQVKLSINGSPKTLKTDSEGRFTHTYTFGKVGENTITATYAGSNNYEAANAETTVNVTKTQATITLAPIEDVTVGSMASISGTLVYADGNPIANAQVKVLINGSPKTLKTDENGAFTHTFKMTKEGPNNITAVFNGNNDYAATETNSTVTVIKAE